LPKIKAWIDEHNPGDPLIPFSVSLEERLAPMSPEEKEEEQKKIGATSCLPKITHAGYSSLDVCVPFGVGERDPAEQSNSSFATSPAVPMRSALGPYVRAPRLHKPRASSSSQFPGCALYLL
jgi:hypothetical protein